MKILTKEEEADHYRATVKGGLIGGAAGLAFGMVGVWGASRRYPAFRGLTLPLRAFLVSSAGTFASIVAADSSSRAFEDRRRPERQYQDGAQTMQKELEAQMNTKDRAQKWLSDNRYHVVLGSWAASMTAAFAIVGRSPHLSTTQKLVQARVYAQGLTLAVIIISLAFETADSANSKGRWETVKALDPDDPQQKRVVEKRIHHEKYAGEDQWMDMVDAEEQRLKDREEAVQTVQKKDKKPAAKQHEKKAREDLLHGSKAEKD